MFSARRKSRLPSYSVLLQNKQVFVKIKTFMKSLLTILLIAGIMGGAVIGLLTMGHHGDCIASQAAGIVCPLNALAYIGIHANFLRSFSEAFLVMILATLFGLALFVSFVFYSNHFYLSRNFKSRFSEINNTNKHRQIYWLSLFENSPTVL